MNQVLTRPWPVRSGISVHHQVLTRAIAEHDTLSVLSDQGVDLDPSTPPWHERERLRCISIYPRWPHHLPGVSEWIERIPTHLFAFAGDHGDPTMIYFTPDERHGREDRKIKMRIARFFRRYVPTITDQQAAHVSNQLTAFFRDVEPLHVTSDPDQIEWVYRNGPRSCMSRTASSYDHKVHPTRSYARAPLAVAYVLNPRQPNRVMARTVVNVDNRHFVRIFGNEATMLKALTKHGFDTQQAQPIKVFDQLCLHTTELAAHPPTDVFNTQGNRRFSHPYLDTDYASVMTYAFQPHAEAPVELLIWHQGSAALRRWLDRYPDGRYAKVTFNGHRAGSCTLSGEHLCAHCGDMFPKDEHGHPLRVSYRAYLDGMNHFLCPTCSDHHKTRLPDTVVDLNALEQTVKYPQRYTLDVYSEEAFTPSHRATRSSWQRLSPLQSEWAISPCEAYPGIIRSALLVEYQGHAYHPAQMTVCRVTQIQAPKHKCVDGILLTHVFKHRLFHVPLYVSHRRQLIKPKEAHWVRTVAIRKLRLATHPHGAYVVPLYRYLLASIAQHHSMLASYEHLRFRFYNGSECVATLAAYELLDYCTRVLRYAMPELDLSLEELPRAVAHCGIPHRLVHDYAKSLAA